MEFDLSPVQWQGLYEEALLETNVGELPQRIIAAERAVFNRMVALATSLDGSSAEKQKLMDALNALRDLRRLSEK